VTGSTRGRLDASSLPPHSAGLRVPEDQEAVGRVIGSEPLLNEVAREAARLPSPAREKRTSLG
jgi:hypothetical protein